MQISIQPPASRDAGQLVNAEAQPTAQRTDKTPTSEEVCRDPTVPRSLWTSQQSSQARKLVDTLGLDPQIAHAYAWLERLSTPGALQLSARTESAQKALTGLRSAAENSQKFNRLAETDAAELQAARRDMSGAAGAVRRFIDFTTPGNTTPAQRLEDAQRADADSTAKQADADLKLNEAYQRARNLLLQAGVCVP